MIKKVVDNRDPYKQGRILVEGISCWISGISNQCERAVDCWSIEIPEIGDKVNIINCNQYQYYLN